MVVPILRPLPVPVRAVILPLLDTFAAHAIGSEIQRLRLPALPALSHVWLQDPQLYHATLFHASSHAVCGVGFYLYKGCAN